MPHTTLTALLPLLALLLPLGAALKGEYELNGRRLWVFGHRVRTREELRRTLRVIHGGLQATEPVGGDARAATQGAVLGS